jgi:hypothetical protein
MIPVGLARTRKSYAGLTPPWDPGERHPELTALFPEPKGTPNHVHAAVRAALRALGLDAERFGTEAWNPLGGLVHPGGRIVLKPNFIRHWNPSARGSLDSVVTHGAMLRALADYAFLAVGRQGEVVVAEAPQHDCDWEVIDEATGLDAMVRFYAERAGLELRVIDLRREEVRYRDGVIVERPASSTWASAAPFTVRASTRAAFAAPTTTRSPRPSTTPAATTATCSRRPCCRRTWW